MRELTLVLPHFRNRSMLAEQQRVWMAYPPDLRARLHVVIVDDVSPDDLKPQPADITVRGLASLRLYHLLGEKIRWNWLACRNLGATVATTDWMLLTDIDHVVPEITLRRLLDGELENRWAYRFARVDAPSPWPWRTAPTPYRPHNDSWLLDRTLFFYEDGQKFVGGYDERLSGCYGSSSEFSRRVLACAGGYVQLREPLVRYPRDVIADASTSPSIYTRKGDQENEQDLALRKTLRQQIPRWRPLINLQPHRLVYVQTAEVCA